MKYALVFLQALLPCTLSAAAPRPVDSVVFEQYVQRLMSEFHVPGLAVGVVDKQGVVYMKGFGVRDVETGLPVTSRTQFAIGSTTKAMTAVSVGMLVDRKLVKWDAPVKTSSLPDFQLYDADATRLVTVRDLLSHRTGLPRHDLAWYGTPFSRQEIYEHLRYLPPTAGLREKAQYQNMMFMTAGMIVERELGLSWENFVRENIFRPLGMNNTSLTVEEMQHSPDFAAPHATEGNRSVRIPFRGLESVAPAGAINSSVEDMGRWLRLQLNGGELDGARILRAETLAEIHRPQIVSSIMGFDRIFPEFGLETYALGWFVQEYLHTKLIHHGGGIDGFITFVGFLPEYETGIVVFGNNSGLVPYFVGTAYMDLLIKGNIGPWEQRLRDFDRKPENKVGVGSPAPLALDSYVGTYHHPGYGDVRVTREGEQLLFAHYVTRFPMEHHRDNAFLPVLAHEQLLLAQEPIVFTTAANGGIDGLLFKADEVAPALKFTRKAAGDFLPAVLFATAPRTSATPKSKAPVFPARFPEIF